MGQRIMRAILGVAGFALIVIATQLVAPPPAFGQSADVCVKGTGDARIAACTAAIALGRWRGRELAWAFYDRGVAYFLKDELERALSNCNEAIRLDLKYANAYLCRGMVFLRKGEHERALSDFSETIRLTPKNALAYANRGVTWLYHGSATKALADFNQAAELDPKNADWALWLDIAAQRNGVASRLSTATVRLDMTVWPGPVIRMYLGQLSPDAVRAAAEDAEPVKRKNRLCEAAFYTGAFLLRQNSKTEATRLFRLAANDCPRNFTDWAAFARAELKALGVEP